MKVKRIANGSYEVHTGHGIYGVDNCPADNPRATGLPAGPRWMVTYPGEITADAEFPTKRAAVEHIRVLHDERMRKADTERQNRARLAAEADADELVWQHADFGDFAVGDRIRFLTIDNGFGGSGDFVSRTGTVTAVTARTLRVECDGNWFGNRAVLRRADWHPRDPQKAV